MPILNNNQMSAVITALSRKTKGICPMCGSADLTVLKQIANLPLYDGVGLMYLNTPVDKVPAVVSVCKNCGNIQQFSIFVLDLAGVFNLSPMGGSNG